MTQTEKLPVGAKEFVADFSWGCPGQSLRLGVNGPAFEFQHWLEEVTFFFCASAFLSAQGA
jgi:hypothetical protein